MKDIAQVIGVIFLVIIGSLLVIMSIYTMLVPISWIICDNSYPTIEHKYDYFAGCLVKPDNKNWIPADRYINNTK